MTKINLNDITPTLEALFQADCEDMRISLHQVEGGYSLSIWDKESDQQVVLDNGAINALVHILMAEGNSLLPQA